MNNDDLGKTMRNLRILAGFKSQKLASDATESIAKDISFKNATVGPGTLSDLEVLKGSKGKLLHPLDMSAGKFFALLTAYGLNLNEFQEATGITLSGRFGLKNQDDKPKDFTRVLHIDAPNNKNSEIIPTTWLKPLDRKQENIRYIATSEVTVSISCKEKIDLYNYLLIDTEEKKANISLVDIGELLLTSTPKANSNILGGVFYGYKSSSIK